MGPAAAILVALVVAARIYAAGVLLYGQQPSIGGSCGRHAAVDARQLPPAAADGAAACGGPSRSPAPSMAVVRALDDQHGAGGMVRTEWATLPMTSRVIPTCPASR